MENLTAYLGLGSNLGDRRENLEQAARLLPRSGETNIHLLRSSSLYETAPWGYAGQPNFLNCVLEIRTSSPPEALLDGLKELEKDMGRSAGRRFGPRVIDLDILLYGRRTVEQAGLQIPHIRLPERAFVLVPLAELAPDLIHPVLGLSMKQMAGNVEGKEGVKLWGPPLELHPGG